MFCNLPCPNEILGPLCWSSSWQWPTHMVWLSDNSNMHIIVQLSDYPCPCQFWRKKTCQNHEQKSSNFTKLLQFWTESRPNQFNSNFRGTLLCFEWWIWYPSNYGNVWTMQVLRKLLDVAIVGRVVISTADHYWFPPSCVPFYSTRPDNQYELLAALGLANKKCRGKKFTRYSSMSLPPIEE